MVKKQHRHGDSQESADDEGGHGQEFSEGAPDVLDPLARQDAPPASGIANRLAALAWRTVGF